MEIDDYLNMASNPKFIPGIYNYCDRWCERCPLASRCFNFASSEKFFDTQESKDIQNEKFWDKLHKVFEFTSELIHRSALEVGIDLENIEEDEEIQKSIQEDKNKHKWARKHPVSKAGKKYYKKVDKWFEDSKLMFEQKGIELESFFEMEIPGFDVEDELYKLKDAVEIIRWYQYFIHIKTSRAMSSYGDFDETSVHDGNGSAKIALIAIDRSIEAWAILLKVFTDQEDKILNIIIQLEKIKKLLEFFFPDARNFIRPGFDKNDRVPK
ncbi:MAG: hypothetical protein JEY97_03625 [Bacteroidales bacterium]|nr:hypothetical protein [Bacteroidales bacterium]